MDDKALIRSVYAPPRSTQPFSFDEYSGSGNFYYYATGRHALFHALQSLNVKPGDAVLFPEFICRDLLAAANSLGAKIAFYPVDETLSPACAPKDFPPAKAVLAVNYFGFPQNLAPFRDYQKNSGALIIEDNAHGLFSKDRDGALLGTCGDIGIFSLRKTIPLFNGGVLLINNAKAILTTPAQVPHDTSESLGFTIKSLLRGSVRNLGISPITTLTGLARLVRKMRTGHEIPPSPQNAEFTLPKNQNPCRTLLKNLAIADPAAEPERRRHLYALCERLLLPIGVTPVFQKPDANVSPYAFAFFAESALAARAQKILNGIGLELFPWPELPDVIAPTAPKRYRSVYLVRFLW